MHRLSISFVSLLALAGTASAQPAPAPGPTEPPVTPADQPPNAPAQPPAEAAATPPPPPPEPRPADPRKLSVGKDSPGATFTPSVLMQGWFVYDETSTLGATTTKLSTSTFRIRRLEIAAGGDIIPGFVKYKLMFDPSRVRDTLNTANAAGTTAGTVVPVRTPASALSTLQDFFITFQSTLADFSIGQFKNTVSWEGYASAARILLPERSFLGNLLGGQRDLGIRLDKTFKTFMYSLNLFNGAGQNNFDNNNQKDVSLRVEIYPVPGLTIGGATYDSLGYRTRAGTKDRWEGDLRYEGGPFLFQSEFIHTHDVFASGAAAVDGQGFYAAVGYRFPEMGSGNWRGVLQPVVRFGMFDPDTNIDLDPSKVAAGNFGGNDERTDYEVGLNYYLRSHEMKLQASYDRQQFDNSDLKAPVNEVIVAAQISF
ncbi:MAG TPA: porin [Kofleriaceae bacterium]|jgi:hypothetical protein